MIDIIDTDGSLALAEIDTTFFCAECGTYVDQDNMKVVGPDKISYHNLVCSDCYGSLENDDDEAE